MPAATTTSSSPRTGRARPAPAASQRPGSASPARSPRSVPRHFLSLPQARTVPVTVLEDLRAGLEQTVAEQAIMCVYGDAGVGKTCGLDTVLASKAAPARGMRLGRLVPRPAPTPADMRFHLAHALGLDQAPHKDPGAFDTVVRQRLAARPHLLVVDEAQRLDTACFEHLRHLFDDPDTRLSIVLVAGEGGAAVLRRQRMLASRTAVWRCVPTLTPAEVRWAIPRFHPLWQHSDTTCVDRLDARLCHGNFRRWAQATHHALLLLGRTRKAGPARRRTAEATLTDLLPARLPEWEAGRRPGTPSALTKKFPPPRITP